MKFEFEFEETEVKSENLKKLLDVLYAIEDDTLYDNKGISNGVNQLQSYLYPCNYTPLPLMRFIEGDTVVNEKLGIYCDCTVDNQNGIREFNFYDKNHECFESYYLVGCIKVQTYKDMINDLANDLTDFMSCNNFEDLDKILVEKYSATSITKEDYRLKENEDCGYFEFECGCWRIDY